MKRGSKSNYGSFYKVRGKNPDVEVPGFNPSVWKNNGENEIRHGAEDVKLAAKLPLMEWASYEIYLYFL